MRLHRRCPELQQASVEQETVFCSETNMAATKICSRGKKHKMTGGIVAMLQSCGVEFLVGHEQLRLTPPFPFRLRAIMKAGENMRSCSKAGSKV